MSESSDPADPAVAAASSVPVPTTTAFTMVKASDSYPVGSTVRECGADVDVPFSELPGEGVHFLATVNAVTSTASASASSVTVLALSNYRFFASGPCALPSGFINLPLGLIETAEMRDLAHLHILCKDARYFRVAFSDLSQGELWTRRVAERIQSPPARSDATFAFAHAAWHSSGSGAGSDQDPEDDSDSVDSPRSRVRRATATTTSSMSSIAEQAAATLPKAWFASEVERLGFDLQVAWRISTFNSGHRHCPTYPEELIVPRCVTDADLENVAKFRSARRVPSIVWRNPVNGAILARCSQPEVGIFGWRSPEDESLVQALAVACTFDPDPCQAAGEINGNNVVVTDSGEHPSISDLSGVAAKPKKVLIVDARSYTAAVGNRARGGGVECQEYYTNSEILFMNLANIHSVRKSFQALRTLLNLAPVDPSSWFQALDNTKWLSHISGLLKSALRVVQALSEEGRPVLVHCSDGWDRTPQIVSLAELMLDPYYRSMEGFEVLVEREWLDYGHKLSDRCGTGATATADANERSPVFLQWLDCVHQLLLQFPCHFEFNLGYLVKVAQHAYAQLFGTLLCNSPLERKNARLAETTRSLWSFLRAYPLKFRNFLYVATSTETIVPRCEVRDLLVWKDVYSSSEWRFGVDDLADPAEVMMTVGGLGKAASCSSESDAATTASASASASREGSESGAEAGNNMQRIHDFALVTKRLETFKQADDTTGEPVKRLFNGSLPKQLSRNGTAAIESSTDTLVASDRLQDSTSEAAAPSVKLPLPPRFFSEPLMDSDGLVSRRDDVQRRLAQLMASHQMEVQSLRRDLYLTRMALLKQQQQQSKQGPRSSNGLDALLLLPSNDAMSGLSAGMAALATADSTASDTSSWEAVDERETKPTLWVPDHAASACMSCHSVFWFGRRKHHCRSCGRLFCGDCSDHLAPIPTEQLYHPVRICDECFNAINVDGVININDINGVNGRHSDLQLQPEHEQQRENGHAHPEVSPSPPTEGNGEAKAEVKANGHSHPVPPRESHERANGHPPSENGGHCHANANGNGHGHGLPPASGCASQQLKGPSSSVVMSSASSSVVETSSVAEEARA